MNKTAYKLSNELEKLGHFKAANLLLRIAYTTEEQADSAEMQGVTSDDKAGFQHEGLFKKLMQQPINLVSRATRPEVAIEAFLNGADIQDLVSRAAVELDLLGQRLDKYSEELGMNRLKQIGAQGILQMMNDHEINAIWFASPEAKEHEQRHQQGGEEDAATLEQKIMQGLGSVLPQDMDDQQKQQIVNGWVQNYVTNLQRYYKPEEIKGELFADEPFIIEKAKEQIPGMIPQGGN